MPPQPPPLPLPNFYRGGWKNVGEIRVYKGFPPLPPLYYIYVYSVTTYHLFKGRYLYICLYPSENGGG